MNQEYLSVFIDETREHLQAWSDGLLELERHQDAASISVIFRAAHTIKGMAMTMAYHKLGELTHQVENILDGIRQQTVAVSQQLIDLLFSALDTLEQLLNGIEATGAEPSLDIEPLTAVLQQLYNQDARGQVSTHNGLTSNQGKLGPINKMEHVVLETTKDVSHPLLSHTLRVDTAKLDAFTDLFSELTLDKVRLEDVQLDLNSAELSETVAHLSGIVDELQALVTSIRMVPVGTVFRRFPRMVRDLARSLNKEVEFEIVGEDTELDRAVLEDLSHPIMHMLRNSLDHGIEPAKRRQQLGKPLKGRIGLCAYSTDDAVIIEVEDDGEGIDSDMILDKALRQGILKESSGLTKDQIYDLVFLPGFSTSREVTHLSGRGVGLDVVKSKVEDLSGQIEVETEKLRGTKFILRLPKYQQPTPTQTGLDLFVPEPTTE